MLVTVFSDAGLCHHIQRASWGGWAKSVRGTARGGGVLKGDISDTCVAEARALLNAIVQGLKDGIIHPGDTIIAQTDNTGVSSIFNAKWKTKAHLKAREETHAEARRILRKYDLTISFRHVKGHKGYRCKRSSVNTYCDRVARYFLDRARDAHCPGRFKRKGPKEPPYGIEQLSAPENPVQLVATD